MFPPPHFLCVILAVAGAALGDGTASFVIDANTRSPMPHFWEECVGSGHMALSHRADYRAHLSMVAEELGMKRIRGHGLFDDDNSVFMSNGAFSFYNVYRTLDFLQSLNMSAVVELSFLPEWLSSGNTTITHYKGYTSPPNNFTAYQNLHFELGKALLSRYSASFLSTVMFEVWNEPNDRFLNGSQEDYFTMFQHAYWGLKNASQSLHVGGPATNSPTTWIRDFLNFTSSQGLEIDFVSTHNYAGGDEENVGDASKVVEGLGAALALVPAHLPYVVTETGASYTQGIGRASDVPGARYHDTAAQASYTVATVAGAVEKGLFPAAFSYWAFSDVFEEDFFPVSNCSFHGGFGLVALACGGGDVLGIPKPTYRAFQLLHETGTQSLNLTAQTSSCPTAGALATQNGTTLDILLYNHAPLNAPIQPCNLSITIENAPRVSTASIRRIDATNANAHTAFEAMGAPDYTTPDQDRALFNASRLTSSPIPFKSAQNTVTFSVYLPELAVAAVRLS